MDQVHEGVSGQGPQGFSMEGGPKFFFVYILEI